jgi:predicted Zn-dependent peptidase
MTLRQTFGRVLLGALAAGLVHSLATAPVLAQHARAGATPPAAPDIRIAGNVYLVPDASARAITGWLIVKAGCADEADGQCRGIAHYLEHLLFINRDNDHKAKVAFFPDGSGNGWTTHRTTVYFQRFPSNSESNAQNLDKLLAYFAGMLSEVRVERVQAERERNVVLQEYQQNTGRNPFARFGVALNLALMPADPLGQRVIGSPETIKAFTPEAAIAFHERWYARNNVSIVLHGPIDRAAVEPPVARHIAPLPEKSIPPHSWKQPRRYEAGNQVLRTTEKDSRQTALHLERIVTIDESDSLRKENDAAAIVLGGFLASRLADSPGEILIERDNLVTDARLSLGRVRAGTFRISFSGVPASGVDPEKAIAAARIYFAELGRKGLSGEVVDRLKMRIRNERALVAQQPALYAQALTNWLSAHYDHDAWLDRGRQLEGVTAASVNRLLSLVAGPGREVTGIMLPGAAAIAGGLPGSIGGTLPTPAETLPQHWAGSIETP